MKVYDIRINTVDGMFKFENLSYRELMETTCDFNSFYGECPCEVSEKEADENDR